MKIEYKPPYINGKLINPITYYNLPFELNKKFVMGDFNYFYLLSHFICKTNKEFRNKAGPEIIRGFLEYLENHLKGDTEIIIKKDNFSEEFIKCAELVCKKKKIHLKIKKEKSWEKTLKNKILHNSFILRNSIKLRIFARYLIGLFRRVVKRTNKEQADVVFLANIRFSTKDETNNYLFGPLIKKLDEDKIKNKIIRYIPPAHSSELKRFIKKFMRQKESYIGDYYRLSHFLKLNKEMKSMRKLWKKLKNDEELKNAFVYKDYNYYDILQPRLELVLNAISYIACDNRIITDTIIKKENFKVLILDSESNIYGRGFLLNLKNKNSQKVLALSHELIYPECILDCPVNEIIKDKKSIFWRPLPDVKCVWGNYAKKVLLANCNYKSELIKVTGNPKFDFLFKKKYNKNRIIKKYSFHPKKKKILIATAHSERLVCFVSEFLSKINEYEIIIKLHPKENKKYVEKYFRKNDLLKIIEGSADLYELINISDFVITEVSSAGFEAMLLNKIVFILNKECAHMAGLPYLQSKAAIKIETADDLLDELKKIKNKKYRDNIRRYMNKFTSSITLGNDGKSSERITSEIKKLLQFFIKF